MLIRFKFSKNGELPKANRVTFILTLNRNSVYLLRSSSTRGSEVPSACKKCVSYFQSAPPFLFLIPCPGEVSEHKVNGGDG